MIAASEVKRMLYMAIGQLIHEERQREIEHDLEMRRLLEPEEDVRRNRDESTTTRSGRTRVSPRQETAGAGS